MENGRLYSEEIKASANLPWEMIKIPTISYLLIFLPAPFPIILRLEKSTEEVQIAFQMSKLSYDVIFPLLR